LSYVKAKTIVGATSPEVLTGGRILVEDDSKISISTVAVIKVVSSERVRLRAQKALREYAELVPLGESVDETTKIITSRFLLPGEGSFVIDAMSFSWDRSIDILLGPEPKPVPPEPEPQPQPDVPPDAFDNIGQRIAKWSVGLPKRNEVGLIYKKFAWELVNNPQADITKVMTAASSERVALLGTDASKYNDITTKLNADVTARWPMSKGVLSDYLGCVAKGYGVK
jgi:hypothetical protein